MIGAQAALAAIDAAFSEVVVYAGGGLPQPTEVYVIWSDGSAPAFQGPGATARTVSFEIPQTTLPARPAKADRITRGDHVWKPNDVTRRDDIGKWEVVVELVGAA
ncbi:MAG TPA: hypothetical protein DEP91_04360 [Sphingomonas bacterium]|jgi:hypothetical protein|uniref:Uncharacterized protein n=1 Tax=Sphingomonas bacterium TaxID=1895847 RepID=A0A3D0W9H3_9SPHN|nr:hypothetical protein [Sphingomonas bacterium]